MNPSNCSFPGLINNIGKLEEDAIQFTALKLLLQQINYVILMVKAITPR